MPTAPSPLEEALGVQAPAAGVPPVSPPPRSSFVMNFNTPNKKMFLPTVLAIVFLLLSLPTALILVKQRQPPKEATCGGAGQPPCGVNIVGCKAQCGTLFQCEEGLTCQEFAGNTHCFNPDCSPYQQINTDCICPVPPCTPTPSPTPTGIPCGSQTCQSGWNCCTGKICNENNQCVEREPLCWQWACPGKSCSTPEECVEPTSPPYASPTPPPSPTPTGAPPEYECLCDGVTADKDVNSLKVDDMVTFTGVGKTSYPQAIGNIRFIVSRDGTTVKAQGVSATPDRQEGGYQFYKANFPYTIKSAGNYTVAIQVECPGGWRD